MNFVDFNEAVGMAMRRGDQSDIPEVAQAAAQIRPMFEATKVRMQELGILPEDVDVSTAQSYLPRIYKFDKILSDRTEFRERIANWIQGISAKVRMLPARALRRSIQVCLLLQRPSRAQKHWLMKLPRQSHGLAVKLNLWMRLETGRN